MGKFEELVQRIEDKKRADQLSIEAAEKKRVEMTEAEQAAVTKAISDAAREDVEDYAKELAALCEQYDEVSTSTRSAKESYMAGIVRMGAIHAESGRLQRKIWELMPKIQGERPPFKSVYSDIENIRHEEPTCYIGKSQIMAAYHGQDWRFAMNRD